MRFLLRGLTGLALTVVTVAMVAYGVLTVNKARQPSEDSRIRPAAERAFTVNVEPLRRETVNPRIRAYGTVRSWRILELRASASGKLIEVSPSFRDGTPVAAGMLLARIDPSDAESDRADAQAALADARAEQSDARLAVTVAAQDLEAARRRKELYERALERQRELQRRDIGSSAAIENAELEVASAEQAILTRSQALNAARNRVERTALAASRAEIALAEAERVLDETRITAPFNGILADVDATLGRLVAQNERLGQLIDPTALEAGFRVSNTQFSRLIGPDGTLLAAPVSAILDLGDVKVTATGRLERSAASVGDGQTGRLVYARLDVEETTVFRDGDFVTVIIDEAPLENVARIPATAASEDGRVLFVGADDRLEERTVQILRRQDNELIVAAADMDGDYVTERLPQLGAGIRINPVRSSQESGESAAVAAAGSSSDHVVLTDERRQAMVAFLKANPRIPADRRDRLLKLLDSPQVPRRIVDQIESRMAGRS